jgi:hypothetical protein
VLMAACRSGLCPATASSRTARSGSTRR